MLDRTVFPVLVACIALLAACGAPAPVTMPPSSPSVLLDKPVPDVRRPTVQGGRFATEETAGRVLVIEFFAQFCKPCQRRLPEAEALRAELGDVAFVGISLDETPDLALAQVQRYGLRFPVIHDAGLVLSGRFRITSLPAVVVVGRDGRVRWVGGGNQPHDALRHAVLAARQP